MLLLLLVLLVLLRVPAAAFCLQENLPALLLGAAAACPCPTAVSLPAHHHKRFHWLSSDLQQTSSCRS
jgi:hypothetical protein